MRVKIRAHRIQLKPGSLERVHKWAAEIMNRPEEALATLRDETVVLECFFLEQNDDGDS